MNHDTVKRIFIRNKWFFIVLCLLLLVNTVFYAVVITGQKKRISEGQNMFSQMRGITTGMKETGGDDQWFRAQVDIREFRNSLRFMPAVPVFADRVKELVDTIQKEGLEVSRVTFKPQKVDEFKLWKYTSKMSVEGSYAKLKGFLAALQNSPNLFCIETLVLEKMPVNGGPDMVRMTVDISTWFRDGIDESK